MSKRKSESDVADRERVRELYAAGRDVDEIADLSGLSVQLVRAVCRRESERLELSRQLDHILELHRGLRFAQLQRSDALADLRLVGDAVPSRMPANGQRPKVLNLLRSKSERRAEVRQWDRRCLEYQVEILKATGRYLDGGGSPAELARVVEVPRGEPEPGDSPLERVDE